MVQARPVGSTRKDAKGYINEKVENHPFMGSGWVKQHRKVLSEKLGRRLESFEDAHHKNEIKDDNHPDNIELRLHGQHSREHRIGNIPWNKGKTQTPEHRAKIAEANRGRVFSEETRAKISKAAKARTDLKRDSSGRYFSEGALLPED